MTMAFSVFTSMASNPSMRFRWIQSLSPFRAAVLFLISFFAVSRAQAQPFHRFGYDLPALTASAMAWGDYDGDGKPDLAVSGINAATQSSFCRLYHNNGDSLVEQPQWFVNVANGALGWADADRDGHPDLLVAGADGVTTAGCVTRLYLNNGRRFTNAGFALPGVRDCALQWGDYDGDGWPDLALTGLTEDHQLIARIYHNDHGQLVDIHAPLTGGYKGCVAWGDFDGDGDLDLAIAGGASPTSSTLPITKIYRNDNGTFTELSTTLPGTMRLQWVDYDNDGKLELFLGSKLYRYAQGQFSDAGVSLYSYSGPCLWADIDHNGYPDLITTGVLVYPLPPFYFQPVGKIYLNDHGRFTSIDAPFTLDSGTLACVDLNGDGSMALAGLGNYTKVYHFVNGGDHPFSYPCFALWRYGSPNCTDLVAEKRFGVDYPERVGWQDINHDGFPELFSFGTWYGLLGDSIQYNPQGKMFWNHASQLSTVNDLPDLSNPSLAWGDINGDGASEVAITGSESGVWPFIPGYASLGLYHNAGGNLSRLQTNLPESGRYSIALADFNHDGRLDLALSGTRLVSAYSPKQAEHADKGLDPIHDEHGYQKISDIYRQDTPTTWTAMRAGLPQVICNLATADYDGDGWPDLALGNNDTSTTRVNAIYHNDHGKLSDSGIKLPDLQTGHPVWVDFDHDGDPDLVLFGKKPDGTPVIEFYRNDGGGKFTDLGDPLPRLDAAGLDWGDYDGDGFPDLAVYGPGFSKVFRNNHCVYTEVNFGLQDVGPMAWGDYDHDGDLDLIVGNHLYRNDRIKTILTRAAVAEWRNY